MHILASFRHQMKNDDVIPRAFYGISVPHMQTRLLKKKNIWRILSEVPAPLRELFVRQSSHSLSEYRAEDKEGLRQSKFLKKLDASFQRSWSLSTSRWSEGKLGLVQVSPKSPSAMP